MTSINLRYLLEYLDIKSKLNHSLGLYFPNFWMTLLEPSLSLSHPSEDGPPDCLRSRKDLNAGDADSLCLSERGDFAFISVPRLPKPRRHSQLPCSQETPFDALLVLITCPL